MLKLNARRSNVTFSVQDGPGLLTHITFVAISVLNISDLELTSNGCCSVHVGGCGLLRGGDLCAERTSG